MFQLFDFLNMKFLGVPVKFKETARGQILLQNLLSNRRFVKTANKDIFIEHRRGRLSGKIGIVRLGVVN